jgi:hypothetical protein
MQVVAFTYRLRGIALSDFVTPAWFTGSGGPYDCLDRVTAAHSVRFGYATKFDPVTTGYHIVGTGPLGGRDPFPCGEAGARSCRDPR